MTREEFLEQHEALAHAIQTGVAHEHKLGSDDGSAKHLRVGVNVAMCETSGLARALVKKGVITEAEYYEAVLEMLHEEVRQYEVRLSKQYGLDVRLG